VCSHWVVLAIGRAEISIGSLGWLLVIESEVAELSNGPLIGLDGTGHTHSYGRSLTFAFCRTALSAQRRGVGVGQQRAVRLHPCSVGGVTSRALDNLGLGPETSRSPTKLLCTKQDRD